MDNKYYINLLLNQCHNIQGRGNNNIDEILRHGNGKDVIKDFIEGLRYIADDIERIISR